uniref:Transposase n=1 Tax=Heterorhabditis bacteriophora TaxID=37862 RepID=A0A1I7X2X9_HETBA
MDLREEVSDEWTIRRDSGRKSVTQADALIEKLTVIKENESVTSDTGSRV